MDISGVSTEALEHELRLRRSRQATALTSRLSGVVDPIAEYDESDEVSEEDSDDNSLFVRERPSARTSSGLEKSPAKPAPFSLLRNREAERHHQFGRQNKKLPHQSGNRIRTAFPEGLISRKRRHSPSRETVESEDERYPSMSSSSAIAYQKRAFSRVTDAKRRKVATRQEEDDRRLAEHLAAGEEDDLLMLMEGEWTKARPGTKGCPIDLDHSTGRATHRQVEAYDYFGSRRNRETIPKQSSRRHGETFDAAIARQLQKEAAEAREARLQEAASRIRDCAVCDDATLVVDLPALASCTHDAEVCADCYTAWLSSQLKANGYQEVKCPGQSCKVSLTYEEIKAYASKEVFERYDVIQARNVLSADPNFRWCRAEGCTSGQIHDVEEMGNEFVCVGCHERFCVVHEGLHDDDETCEEYEYRISGQKDRDERRKEDEASEEAVKSLAKKCPYQKCGAPIQKNGGCNHITCKLR